MSFTIPVGTSTGHSARCRDNYKAFLFVACLLIFPSVWKDAVAEVPASATAAVTTSQHSAPDYTEAFFEIHVSGYPASMNSLVLQDASGRILLNVHDLAKFRINIPAGLNTIQTHNSQWIALEQLARLHYRFDMSTQSLWLDVDPDLFDATQLDYAPMSHITPEVAGYGAFLNYDVSAQKSKQNVVGMYLDGGIFGAGWAARSQLSKSFMDSRFIRLDSALTLDNPTQAKRLTLFDSMPPSGLWGKSFRLGGIQWASNYHLQPYRLTYPTPLLTGQTSFPSNIDVFVNNAAVYSASVPPGPFSITDFPVTSGQGEVSLHVRDIMGRDKVISQSFYAIPELLKPGLHDFSYSAGFERLDFGQESNHYGRGLMVANHRYGINENLTAEFRTEAASGQYNVGFGSTTKLLNHAALGAAWSISHNQSGNGQLLALVIERRSQDMAWSVRTQITSPQFTQLGVPSGKFPPVRQTVIHTGLSSGMLSGLGLTYVQSDERGQANRKIFTASYSANLNRDLTWSTSAFRLLSESSGFGFSVMLNFAFAEHSSASVILNQAKQSTSTTYQLQKNSFSDNELGYRLAASTGEAGYLQAMFNTQNEFAAYRAELASMRHNQSYRLSVAGGMALIEKDLFFGRSLGDSFAVVDIPNIPNVRVYADNRPVARTNATGQALVPALQPYQLNQLSVELADLPLNARISKTKIGLVPYYSSGYHVQMPITLALDAVLNISTTDGKPIPPGSRVELQETQEIFPVGFNGLLYLTGLQATNHLQVYLPNKKSCSLVVKYVKTAAALPHLGQFVCRESNL